MSNLRTKMTQDMIVRGLAKTTQQAYLHAVTELRECLRDVDMVFSLGVLTA